MPATFWTIGHSTRPIDEFLDLLRGQAIGLVADVRRFPGSRRYPHFNEEALAASLAEVGISYRHMLELGGRRGKRAPDSPNAAWRVEAFNAFADHMATPGFREAIDELVGLAEDRRIALMCSEAVPWRCHRRLIADALVARGHEVHDILGPGKVDRHALTPFARLVGDVPTYPAEPLFEGPGDGTIAE